MWSYCQKQKYNSRLASGRALSVWLSVHLSVQGRLGRVAKFHSFYLVSFAVEFIISIWNLGLLGILLEYLPQYGMGH